MLGRIVIVGAGRTSGSLIERLSRRAPVQVVDTSAEALAALPAPGGEGFRHPVEHRVADGTSRIVLSDLRGDTHDPAALVAATGEDRMNLEVARLAVELDFRPVVAIAIDPALAPRYEALGARCVVRAALLGQVVESALRHDGLAMGELRGDIVEVGILPSSPAIGVPLSQLEPSGWRVAAIYRGGQLVLPTGATCIAAEDRVLLVGEPRVLPIVAENLRQGAPTFPRRFGPNVVVYLPEGRDRALEVHAELLTVRTQAAGLVRVHPGAEPSQLRVEEPAEAGPRRTFFGDAPLEGVGLGEHVRSLRARQPGLVVARPAPRRWTERMAGRPGAVGTLCDGAGAPVFFARGEPAYGRVVHAVGEASDVGTVDLAIDLARQLAVPLVLMRVDLPRYFDTARDRVDGLVAAAERRAHLHQMAVTLERTEGNPVRRLLAAVHPSDLLVVARHRGVRDSFAAPDVALRLAREAPCSTLVETTTAETAP